MPKVAKQKLDWNTFKGNGKMAVHCQTEEEANQFLRLMHEHGMKWNGGQSYITRYNRWREYKERTCYYGDGTFCDIDWANKHGHTILKFSMLDFD